MNDERLSRDISLVRHWENLSKVLKIEDPSNCDLKVRWLGKSSAREVLGLLPSQGVQILYRPWASFSHLSHNFLSVRLRSGGPWVNIRTPPPWASSSIFPFLEALSGRFRNLSWTTEHFQLFFWLHITTPPRWHDLKALSPLLLFFKFEN